MDSTICDDVCEATKGKVYGYARVSTRDQNLDRQLQALAAFPVVRADACSPTRRAARISTGRRNRRLMARLRPGDVLVVKSIDRLGR